MLFYITWIILSVRFLTKYINYNIGDQNGESRTQNDVMVSLLWPSLRRKNQTSLMTSQTVLNRSLETMASCWKKLLKRVPIKPSLQKRRNMNNVIHHSFCFFHVSSFCHCYMRSWISLTLFVTPYVWPYFFPLTSKFLLSRIYKSER